MRKHGLKTALLSLALAVEFALALVQRALTPTGLKLTDSEDLGLALTPVVIDGA